VKLSRNASIRIEPSARLALYVAGESADYSGDGIINPGGAGAFRHLGLPGNTSSFKNNTLKALVYAPRAACTI
jgi:hypothetical protein